MFLIEMAPLLAQANRGGGGGGDAGIFGGVFCLCYGVFLVLLVVIHIMFLLNLSKAFEACSPRNRSMEPGQVWLNLIPLFGIVWMFITIIRLAESLQREYRSRGMSSDDPEFGKMTGILYMVLSLIGCGPVGLVFFIMYWMKIAKYRNELAAGGRGRALEDDEDDAPRRRRRDEEDDEDDDRPRRRPRRDDDE